MNIDDKLYDMIRSCNMNDIINMWNGYCELNRIDFFITRNTKSKAKEMLGIDYKDFDTLTNNRGYNKNDYYIYYDDEDTFIYSFTFITDKRCPIYFDDLRNDIIVNTKSYDDKGVLPKDVVDLLNTSDKTPLLKKKQSF